MSNNNCLYCGNTLGLRRFTGSKFCSEAHANADADRMTSMMLDRLRISSSRFREALLTKDEIRKPLRLAS
jgi:hypothetical protein